MDGDRDACEEQQGSFVGDPDGFERLWTPHRAVYIGGADRPSTDGCPFCVAPQRTDEEALIVARGRFCYVVLNLYPYNPGHVLVAPYRHIPDYTDLTTEERIEFSDITATAMRVLREVSAPAGLNLGMNQGEVAGAGIAAHLHQHIVPRWQGDMNFFPIIAQTKAMPELLSTTREKIAQAWPVDGRGGEG